MEPSAYENIPCELCGQNDFKILFAQEDKVIQDVVTKYSSSSDVLACDQIVKCQHCGLIYVNPRLKPELIYSGYSEGLDENYVSQAEGRLKTFQKSVKLVEKYSPSGKILDIGCAAGFFLKAAHDHKWEAYGLEPSRWLAEWGNKHYGLNIQSKSLEEARFPDNFFDVITLWDVLEHMPHPFPSLKECFRILKPGGVLFVNFPDFHSLFARILKKKWWFCLAVHLFYFSPKTIKAMLEKAGFKVMKIKRHYQTLSLGYLFFRFGQYSKFLASLFTKVSRTLHLDNLQVPYYASQKLVIAKKS